MVAVVVSRIASVACRAVKVISVPSSNQPSPRSRAPDPSPRPPRRRMLHAGSTGAARLAREQPVQRERRGAAGRMAADRTTAPAEEKDAAAPFAVADASTLLGFRGRRRKGGRGKEAPVDGSTAGGGGVGGFRSRSGSRSEWSWGRGESCEVNMGVGAGRWRDIPTRYTPGEPV